MPDVRMPDGTIITNVPEGTTKAELLSKLGKANAVPGNTSKPNPYAAYDRYSIGPDTSGLTPAESQQATFDQLAQQTNDVESQVPFFNRPSTADAARKYGIPALASMLVPGAAPAAVGIDAAATAALRAAANKLFFKQLLTQSAIGGLASGGVNLAQQSMDNQQQGLSNQPLDYGAAAKDAGYTAAGNLAAGTVLKGLGAAARKLFVTPLTPEAQAAADFAKGSKAGQEIRPFQTEGGGVGSELVDVPAVPSKPFPLSSASPGSRGAKAQNLSDIPLLGNLANQHESNKVVQFLNSNLSTLTPGATPIKEAAANGQQFLRSVLQPGEDAFKDTFGAYRQTVGDLTEIPLNNTREALQQASAALRKRAETGPLADRIKELANVNPESMNAQQLDNLYSGLLNAAKKSESGQVEMNKVLPAIAQDMDAVGKQFGLTFGEDVAKANEVRAQYRDLAKIPKLVELSKSVRDPQKWLDKLFDPSNGEALGKLRELNPGLYHDLADSYVASNIRQFNEPLKDSFGTALNGKGLREWYVRNADRLKLVLGSPQAKALDNFTNYAAHVNGAIERGAQSKVDTALGAAARFAGSGSASGAGAFFSGPLAPTLVGLSEGGSFALARGLSDPNSALFKLFTKGVPPSLANFWIRSGQLAGQSAAQAAKPSDR